MNDAASEPERQLAITVPQIRLAIAQLLRRSLGCDKPARIRRTMTRRTQRNEQARFYHWKSRNRLAPKRVQRAE